MSGPSEKFALVSAASASVSRMRAGAPHGKSSLMMSTGLALPIDFLAHGSSGIYGIGGDSISGQCAASPSEAPARTLALWPIPSEVERDTALLAAAADYSSAAWRLSSASDQNLSCGKTCRLSSVATTVGTFKRSLGRLPNAVTWDQRGCWMRSISECPRSGADWSWSRVLDVTPHASSWLTPGQWSRYLARLRRAKSAGELMRGLAILLRRRINTGDAAHGLISALRFSWLRRTDGVRMLTGPERLSYMGFPRDWMSAILSRLMPQGTQFRLRWRDGLLKF